MNCDSVRHGECNASTAGIDIQGGKIFMPLMHKCQKNTVIIHKKELQPQNDILKMSH